MKSLIEANRDNGRVVLNVTTMLDDISSAAFTMGNNELGSRLLRISKMLHNSEDDLSSAIGREINQGFTRSMESSNNMVRAALAGAELVRK